MMVMVSPERPKGLIYASFLSKKRKDLCIDMWHDRMSDAGIDCFSKSQIDAWITVGWGGADSDSLASRHVSPPV